MQDDFDHQSIRLERLKRGRHPAPLMARGRSLRDFEPLMPAEQRLLEAVIAGEECKLSASRPFDATDPALRIRGAFVRFLALGGDGRAPVHEFGLWLTGAVIAGNIELDGSPEVRPLWFGKCLIDGDLTFYDARLLVISLDGCQIGRVQGDHAIIDGSVLMRHGFEAKGAVILRGVDVRGDFSCDSSIFRGSVHDDEFIAIDLSTADIRRDVHLRDGFTAYGPVRLVDTKVGGVFDAAAGKFLGTQPGCISKTVMRRSLECVRINVSGSLFLRHGCVCKGEASFVGATIGGDLDCRGGSFEADENDPRAQALRLNRVAVAGTVYLSDGFSAKGAVRLNGAEIGTDLDCVGGLFDVHGLKARRGSSPGDPRKHSLYSIDALSLSGAEIKATLFLTAVEGYKRNHAHIKGSLDLKGTRVTSFLDSEEIWPKPPHEQMRALSGEDGTIDVIYLDGFIYDRLVGGAPVSARLRKRWLRCQPQEHLYGDFRPQPFEQLIKALRASGHNEEARRIAVFKQDFLLQNAMLFWWEKPSRRWLAPFVNFGQAMKWLLFGLMTGYGYWPIRTFIILLGLWLASALFFSEAAKHQVFAPRDPQVYLNESLDACRPAKGGNWVECNQLVKGNFAEHPSFSPLVYSADLILPVVDLEQETNWVPMKRAFTIELPLAGAVTLPDWTARAVMWFEILFGWAGSLLLVAALSGIVKLD